MDNLDDCLINMDDKLTVVDDFNAKNAKHIQHKHAGFKDKRVIEMEARPNLVALKKLETSTFRRLGYRETITDILWHREH